MDFRLTADERALRDAARGLLAREVTPALVRARYGDVTEAFAPLWRLVTDAGWTGILLSEKDGGVGLGVAELALVCEEAGRVLAPVPLWETGGRSAAYLAGVADRTDAWAEVAAALLDGQRVTTGRPLGWAEPRGEVLTIELELVPEAQIAEMLLVVAGGSLWSVRLAACTVTPHQSLDPTRTLCDVAGRDLPAVRLGVLTEGARRRADAIADVTLAASLLGTTRALLDATVDYVKVRRQFGVPVGSFQAVQHKLADVLVALEKANASVYRAAMVLDAPSAPAGEADRTTAIACVAAAEAARRAAKEAAQLHGGIGYTWEHDLHLLIRRVYGDVALLGGEAEHLQRLQAFLVA